MATTKELLIDLGRHKALLKVKETHTLLDVRVLIADEVDDHLLPSKNYCFYDDGIPLSHKQEDKFMAWEYIGKDTPALSIREDDVPRPVPAPAWQISTNLEMYRFKMTSHKRDFFPWNGFGPFTIKRRALCEYILGLASPHDSFHINGSKGSGKTILLRLLGQHLHEQGRKNIFYFYHSAAIDQEQDQIQAIVSNKTEAYFLIDETQFNADSSMLGRLINNEDGHKVTTIGAGVPPFVSDSGEFGHTIDTSHLFLSEDDLVTEGVIDYFVQDVTDHDMRKEIGRLLRLVRHYVGGHVFPLLRLSELLVAKLHQSSITTADEAISLLNSADFRSSKEFDRVATRITPLFDFRVSVLFQKDSWPKVVELIKRGFCDSRGQVVSMFLFDLYLCNTHGPESGPVSLERGLAGVQELLCFGVPRISWHRYEYHGRAFEDALAFDLLVRMSAVKALGVMLFNPKLVTAKTDDRRPDIYFGSTVHSYVECVFTKANTATSRKEVEKHILRFFCDASGEAHYEIQNADFAILHFQDWGSEPMQVEDETCQNCFNQRVFTCLMKSKELYLGNTCIARP